MDKKGVVAMTFKERITKDLNPEQLRFATSDSRYILALAGPGSGKTRSLTYRVAYLIDQGVDPSRILLMTFTNRAASEIEDRVGAMLGSVRRGMTTGTFHSVGARFLRRYARAVKREPNFTILDESDSKDLMKVAFADVTADISLSSDEKKFLRVETIQKLYSRIKSTDSTFEQVFELFPEYESYRDIILGTLRRYEERKRNANAMDFDDLVHSWLKVLEKYPQIAEEYASHFQHVMVDEYQDTNITQGKVILQLAKYTNLAVVGDDAQSIYRFNGAEVGNILEFQNLLDNVEVIRMEQNYRSTPEIVALANASIARNRYQHKKTMRTERQSGCKPTFIEFYSEQDEASWIADKIMEFYNEKGIPLREMAVLFRVSRLSKPLELELNRRNIPYEVFGGIRFTEREQIKDVLAWLRIMNNPKDELAWRRVLLLQDGIGEAAVRQIWEQIASASSVLTPLDLARSLSSIPKRAVEGWNRVVETLERMTEASTSIADMIRATVTPHYVELVKRRHDEDFDERLEGIELLAKYASRYRSLEEFLESVSLEPPQINEETNAVLESERDILTLSTVHSAKGKEWEVVFLISLNEGVFPTTSDAEDIEEARRLFFVAVTRPKTYLYLTRANEVYMGGEYRVPKISRFIQEVWDYLVVEEPEESVGADDLLGSWLY